MAGGGLEARAEGEGGEGEGEAAVVFFAGYAPGDVADPGGEDGAFGDEGDLGGGVGGEEVGVEGGLEAGVDEGADEEAAVGIGEMEVDLAGADLGAEFGRNPGDGGGDVGERAAVVGGELDGLANAEPVGAGFGDVDDDHERAGRDEAEERGVGHDLLADGGEFGGGHAFALEAEDDEAGERGGDGDGVGGGGAGEDRGGEGGEIPAGEAVGESVDGVGVGEFDGGGEFALGGEEFGAVEIDDGVAGGDDGAGMEGGGIAFQDAAGETGEDDLEGAVVVTDGAIRVDGGGGGAGGDGGEREAHAALLFEGEFAGGDLGHGHAANGAGAGFGADEVHHGTGPTFAGDGADGGGGGGGGGEEGVLREEGDECGAGGEAEDGGEGGGPAHGRKAADQRLMSSLRR